MSHLAGRKHHIKNGGVDSLLLRCRATQIRVIRSQLRKSVQDIDAAVRGARKDTEYQSLHLGFAEHGQAHAFVADIEPAVVYDVPHKLFYHGLCQPQC